MKPEFVIADLESLAKKNKKQRKSAHKRQSSDHFNSMFANCVKNLREYKIGKHRDSSNGVMSPKSFGIVSPTKKQSKIEMKLDPLW